MATIAGASGGIGDPVAAAPEPNGFRAEGAFWTLTFGGRTARLADAKGLRDWPRSWRARW